MTNSKDGTNGRVMVVDDQPANLKLMEEMLSGQGYRVQSFPKGRLAIAAAALHPPDLVLLDINMPELDGFAVCELLKSDPKLSGIPVIFLSALSGTEDKVRAFRAGGVDYITKPFQFEEVQARVETQLTLGRARKAEQQLLEETLGGAVKTLSELVHLASPLLAARSQAIGAALRFVSQGMGVTSWQYDLAATLCLVGCITLPDDTFERAYLGQPLSADEQSIFQAYPENGARLLANIPRLEEVAEIIRAQMEPDLNATRSETVRLGTQMLHLAIELDRRLFRGLTVQAAMRQIRTSKQRLDPAMLTILQQYAPPDCQFQVKSLYLRQLRVGMILDSDVISLSNSLTILKQGTILNETWIERMGNFARSQKIKEPLLVKVPV